MILCSCGTLWFANPEYLQTTLDESLCFYMTAKYVAVLHCLNLMTHEPREAELSDSFSVICHIVKTSVNNLHHAWYTQYVLQPQF